jgi:hypothetical protein
MKHFLLYGISLLLTTNSLLAQNFEPGPGVVDDKIKALINRYGKSERIYLNDTKRETFDARGGSIYIVAFTYTPEATGTRRMMVYEVGANNEKKNIKYPDFSKAYRGAKGQLFYVRLDPEGDENTITTYKIDTDAGASVYIYKAMPGVK